MEGTTYILPVKFDELDRRAYKRWGIKRAQVIILNGAGKGCMLGDKSGKE